MIWGRMIELVVPSIIGIVCCRVCTDPVSIGNGRGRYQVVLLVCCEGIFGMLVY